jgi:predicted metal-dependent hydrolase
MTSNFIVFIDTYNDQTIDYHVIYKKRKSLGIYIDVYGNIELRVPRETSDKQISEMIEAKWNWILTKQQEMKEKTKGFKEKEYVEGEVFLYLGKSYPIKIQEVQLIKSELVELQEEELVINIKHYEESKDKEEKIKKLLKKFYYKRCKALYSILSTKFQGKAKRF